MKLLSFFPLARLPECNPGELLTVAAFLFMLAGACYLAKRWGRR